jgi:hypothetical protein
MMATEHTERPTINAGTTAMKLLEIFRLIAVTPIRHWFI